MTSRKKLQPILISLSAICLIVWLSPTAHCADGRETPEKLTTIEGITEYSLKNGMRILLFPDPSTSTVTVNLTVFVGSRHEGYGETGMAHLLEHMLFKGTPSHPDVPKVLRDHGANFNGTTWMDRTNYYETMPAGEANLEFGILLEADRLINCFVRREDLASEMTVVRNEFEMGENSPENILSQRMKAAAYDWHNYSKPTIGNRSDIERVPIDRLQAFYHKHYQPDNCMLIVAGNFDEKKALETIVKSFGQIKKPSRVLDATYTEEPTQDGERAVTLRRVGSVGVVGAIYHIPAGPHPDYPAIEVLAQLLVAEPSGLLYKSLVTSGKASRVNGYAEGLHDPGTIQIMAQVDPKLSLEAVRDLLLQNLEGLSPGQLSSEEVERAKRTLLKERELLMTRSNRIGVELSDWAALGDWRLFFLHRDRIANVTAADVVRVAGQYFKQSNRTVGLFVPTERPARAPIPSTPAVADLVKNYKGAAALAAGEAFDPTPSNIEQRLHRQVMPGGVKAGVLAKKTRGASVVAELTLRYGNEDSLRSQRIAADLLGPMMTRGTKKHNRQQLKDEFDRLKAQVRLSGSAGQLQASIECKRAAMPEVLRLLGEILREPTFPKEELDIIKRQRKESLEKGKKEPQALVMNAIRRKLSPYPRDDVRYVASIDEELAVLDGISVEQLRRIYEEQVGASAGEFVVVGDVDPSETLALVEPFLKDWIAPVPYRHIGRSAHPDQPGSSEDILTPDKANAIYLAAHDMPLGDDDRNYPALRMADFLLGEAPLSSRLSNRVRGKDGLSYGVGSRVTAEAKDKFGTFMIFAICNPANMKKVDSAIAEELNKFVDKGVDAKELGQAKSALLQSLKVERSNDAMLAAMLGENLFVDRTFAYYADLEKRIEDLTPEEVNSAIRSYLAPKRLNIIRGGDFKKKG